jgi:REP element-mobilizing transposase RayT
MQQNQPSNHSSPIKIGGVDDHVHILFSVSKNIALADLIGRVKGSCSRLFCFRPSGEGGMSKAVAGNTPPKPAESILNTEKLAAKK